FQLPPASHEIEKLRAVGEADETLRPDHVRGQSAHETFETIARESFIGGECERFELWLVLMLGGRDLSPPRLRDAEQKFRIDPTTLGENDCRSWIVVAQFPLKRLDLRRTDKIRLVQKQNVCALDLQTCGVTEFGKSNQHVRVDYRNDAVQPALRQCLLDVEHERFRFGEASGLDDDHFGRHLLDDLGYCSLEFTEQRAANAAAAQF